MNDCIYLCHRSSMNMYIPNDLEVDSTPRTRGQSQQRILPPRASTRLSSSGLSGCVGTSSFISIDCIQIANKYELSSYRLTNEKLMQENKRKGKSSKKIYRC